jgi:site-specific recombinase XerC
MSKRKPSVPAHLKRRIARIHVLTHRELRRLFSVIPNLRDRALFLIAYRHGLRASEIAQMEKQDVDLSTTKLHIRRIGRGMNAKHAMQADEALALKQYLKERTDQSVALFVSVHGTPVTRRGLDWLMKLYGHKARLPSLKCHFHSLKHSITAHLLGAGVELQIVHKWLGHSALKNTALYVYLAVFPRDNALVQELLGTLPT